MFKEKLKMLKERLKVWNVEVFGNLDTLIGKLEPDHNMSNDLASSRSLNEEETNSRRILMDDLWKYRMMKDNMMHQKARQKWLGRR